MKEIKDTAWNLSCLDSFSEYKETELHVNQLEVEKWMDSWGTDTELPQPACHRGINWGQTHYCPDISPNKLN